MCTLNLNVSVFWGYLKLETENKEVKDVMLLLAEV
jgi:hypothetical protein